MTDTDDFYLPITEALFRGGIVAYTYQRIRCPEYDALLDKAVALAMPSQHPTFIQVSGIPGAGKSCFCGRQYADALVVQFDAIMAHIEAYQQDCVRMGLIQAFSKWEMPARVIGYELIRRLIMRKASFVLEHSGMNAAHIKLVEVLKRQGYHTQIQFLGCDVKEACRRVVEREKKIARHTPPELILRRSAAILEYLDTYKKIMDDAFIWDLTNAENWRCVEHWQNGQKIS